jgi:hypothetical protein
MELQWREYESYGYAPYQGANLFVSLNDTIEASVHIKKRAINTEIRVRRTDYNPNGSYISVGYREETRCFEKDPDLFIGRAVKRYKKSEGIR